MKSKLFVFVLSMFAMSFVAANGAVDAKSVIVTDDAIEENFDEEIADASEEVVKAKKAEEAVSQDEESCE
jgi:hypothetical protein